MRMSPPPPPHTHTHHTQAAEDALNVLTKKDMSELKAYAKPPALVELTLGGERAP